MKGMRTEDSSRIREDDLEGVGVVEESWKARWLRIDAVCLRFLVGDLCIFGLRKGRKEFCHVRCISVLFVHRRYTATRNHTAWIPEDISWRTREQKYRKRGISPPEVKGTFR